MALKIIHTADWHIGQTFYDFDRTAEHEAFLNWLLGQLPLLQADVLLISGDVFDVSNPSAQAQRLFFRFLKEAHTAQPRLQIVITAGNHDSAARLEAPQALLDAFNTRIVGTIQRHADRSIDYSKLLLPLYNRQGEAEALCLAIPFLRLGDYPAGAGSYTQGVVALYEEAYEYALSHKKEGQALVAMGHLHTMNADVSEEDRSERSIVGGVEFVPVHTFNEGLAYTALGHIHRPQIVGSRQNVRYSGSPLPMSFSEKNYKHQIVVFTIQNGALESISPVLVPVSMALRRVPEQPLPLAEVLAKLQELPEAADAPFAYLEVPVLLQGPEPSLKFKIESALKGKAVHLAKISVSYPKKQQGEAQPMLELAQLKPHDLLQKVYKQKYQADLPEHLHQLFEEALTEVQ